MFTGIVQTVGTILTIRPQTGGQRLVIDRQGWSPRDVTLEHGDSICVSGVCLTLTAFDEQTLSFDVITETLARSTLGEKTVGSRVNLEPSLTPSTPIGGHLVQGHVDGLGTIERVQRGDDWRITLAAESDVLDLTAPKGSICIDGVSLTVAAVAKKHFEVAIIPTTLEMTTLADVREGDRVNLETDMIARTVVHYLKRQQQAGGGVTMQTLAEQGFLG